jgi:hypothetical protein
MGSDKEKALAVAFIAGFIAIAVIFFQLIGGRFDFLFIHFSAKGVFGRMIWVLPLIMLALQQFYVVPTFMRGYWDAFAESGPSPTELYVPVLNEYAVLPTVLQKPYLVSYIVIAVFVLLGASPLPQFLGTGDAVTTMTFYSFVVAIALFVILSVVRGVFYIIADKAIYNRHCEFFGKRGLSPAYWLFKVLYCVPLARSLSMSMSIQILDKITKFNDLSALETVLTEEEK